MAWVVLAPLFDPLLYLLLVVVVLHCAVENWPRRSEWPWVGGCGRDASLEELVAEGTLRAPCCQRAVGVVMVALICPCIVVRVLEESVS